MLRPFARSVAGPPSLKGAACLVAALFTSACATPDPKALLSVNDLETYWAVDPSIASTQYLAPAVRFKLRSRSDKPQTSVQAQAVFRQKGEGQTWGSDYTQAASRQKPLSPGQEMEVLLKSDARYTSPGPPQLSTNWTRPERTTCRSCSWLSVASTRRPPGSTRSTLPPRRCKRDIASAWRAAPPSPSMIE